MNRFFFAPFVAFSVFLVPVCATAQQAGAPFWAQGPASRAAEAPRVRTTPDGFVQSAGAPPGTAFAGAIARAASADAAAVAFMGAQARWFFDGDAAVQFAADRVRSDGARSRVRLSQTYRGLPVFGAGITLQLRGNDVEFVLADIMREFEAVASGAVSTTPLITADEAQVFGTAWVRAKLSAADPQATVPVLHVYDPEVVGNVGPVALVWVFEVADASAPLREVVLVNADDGDVVFNYSLIHDAKNRRIFDAGNSNSLGALARTEGQGPTGNVYVDEAYDYLGDTYDFYLTEHGRDGIDGAGGTLSATVRFCEPGFPCPYANAYWDGSRMWFGQGFQVDDVAAHELTHGVTTNESNLIYANQSGAINESLSDMWGEWVDLVNGAGTDTPAVRWELGEDIPGVGTLRDMANPPAFGDPDRMGSPLFYTGTGDNGGVHINSGVGNKLAYLLTDGGSFNGYTVSGMGISAVADLMYECQVHLLTPGSNYFDFYDAITQAAINIGFNAAQRANVETACRAVEIREFEGVGGFTALTETAIAQVDLQWSNPIPPATFVGVRVRRSTTGFPSDPDSSGTLVYQGAAQTFADTNVTLGTLYYYTIWTYHGAVDRSQPSYATATAGTVESSPTERFTLTEGDEFDMENIRIAFWPNGPAAYTVKQYGMTEFPTDPSTGTPIVLPDDGSRLVTLHSGKQVIHFGTAYSAFYVNSNGRITFGAGSPNFQESYSEHFFLRAISAVFDDLDPTAGGTVRVQQESDRVAVTFEKVPEYTTSNENNFQIEMFYNGLIRITYLRVDARDLIAGLSPGGGVPAGFVESDLSGVPVPVAPVKFSALVLLGIGLAGFGLVLAGRRVRRQD